VNVPRGALYIYGKFRVTLFESVSCRELFPVETKEKIYVVENKRRRRHEQGERERVWERANEREREKEFTGEKTQRNTEDENYTVTNI